MTITRPSISFGADTTHPGESGQALWRTLDIGDIRVRVGEYTPGYLAGHWCDRGHVLYVLEGELHTGLRDGRSFTLPLGVGFRRCRASLLDENRCEAFYRRLNDSLDLLRVIPGWSARPDPKSRDSGFALMRAPE